VQLGTESDSGEAAKTRFCSVCFPCVGVYPYIRYASSATDLRDLFSVFP
jgi:hypothetical protein